MENSLYHKYRSWRGISRHDEIRFRLALNAAPLAKSPFVDALMLSHYFAAIHVHKRPWFVFHILTIQIVNNQSFDGQINSKNTSEMKDWKLRFPTKQMPVLSRRSATWSRPDSAASWRTRLLSKSPMGNRVLCREACLTWLRKKVWSLKRSRAIINLTVKV